MMLRLLTVAILSVLWTCCAIAGAADAPPHTLWLEAETFAPLKGGNFSYQQQKLHAKGSWSVAGPGVAAEWTQGGESEWMSIAARPDETAEIVVSRDAVVPAAGKYTLWVRYADYRAKKESFGVRIKQGDGSSTHVFGEQPVVDELDPMKLLWDWSFGWGRTEVALRKGPMRVELYTTGPTEARRQIDVVGLTTDAGFRPGGREKPDAPIWRLMREMQKEAGEAPAAAALGQIPDAWKIEKPPAFVWNVGEQWMEELKKPADSDRIDAPFGVDPALLKDFLAAQRGKKGIPIFSHALSGPSWHIPHYPLMLGDASPFLDWLGRHPKNRFALMLNYADPNWPKGVKEFDKQAVYANLEKLGDRFVGYIAGESIAHTGYDAELLEKRVKAAKSRADVLAALREVHTASVVKKFSDYSGRPLTPEQAFKPLISCLSANNEAFAHALGNWGCERIGHENTGNSPTLARRLAFLRGAARQFGAKVADYQSANLGDSATMFSRQNFFYGASSRYILDNSYDAWAGAGVNWLLKDYVLFHLAGCDVFYNEQGIDLFWKPGGNSAGDDFPVQLSPKGKVAEAILRVAEKHPRGTQVTPVAFLLDEAHGWAQERFTPGGFGLDPQLNPALLAPGRREQAIRAWFDVAWFPAPETQNEPASGIRQTYVNGIFGDIFDVIVTAKDKAQILKTYPVVIAAGEVPLSEQWGGALKEYVDAGGTVVACDGSLTGPGAAILQLPKIEGGEAREASQYRWNGSGEGIPSNVFQVRPLPADFGKALATTPDGNTVAAEARRGQGRLILVGVPLGLGLDERPVPVLAHVMQHVTRGLLPLKVAGDVEWTLNRLGDGRLLVGLLNNRGVIKPQHGVLPTDHHAAQQVTLTAPFAVRASAEWMTETDLKWEAAETGSRLTLELPAGGVRLVEIEPAR